MIIIVLGSGINEKGVLSKETVKRLKEAYFIHQKNKSPFLLCGKYNFPVDKKNPPKVTEEEVMRDYLLSQGISSENIFLEKKSRDTISAAYFAKTEHIIPRKEKEVVVVTSDTHLERVEYVFYKVFGEAYSLHFIGTLSKLPCQIKGMVIAKQNILTEKAKHLLDGIKEGDHELVEKKILSSNRSEESGIGFPQNITNHGKKC